MAQFKRELYTLTDGTLAHCTEMGGYPLFYLGECDRVLCADCATKNMDELTTVDAHWEGQPLNCDECNAEIESAYGDPDE